MPAIPEPPIYPLWESESGAGNKSDKMPKTTEAIHLGKGGRLQQFDNLA